MLALASHSALVRAPGCARRGTAPARLVSVKAVDGDNAGEKRVFRNARFGAESSERRRLLALIFD